MNAVDVVIADPHSALISSSIGTVLAGIFVIWALYDGHKASKEYFRAA